MEKIELEAEMGRLFLRIEQLKAEQMQAAQRITQIIETLKEITQNAE
jgi:hypothetical protein